VRRKEGHIINEYELRRRLGLGPDTDFDWVALRGAYRMSSHEEGQPNGPIILNKGTTFEEPFGVTLALAYGERLADEWLR
jgi:hypothetical protein